MGEDKELFEEIREDFEFALENMKCRKDKSLLRNLYLQIITRLKKEFPQEVIEG